MTKGLTREHFNFLSAVLREFSKQFWISRALCSPFSIHGVSVALVILTRATAFLLSMRHRGRKLISSLFLRRFVFFHNEVPKSPKPKPASLTFCTCSIPPKNSRSSNSKTSIAICFAAAAPFQSSFFSHIIDWHINCKAS